MCLSVCDDKSEVGHCSGAVRDEMEVGMILAVKWMNALGRVPVVVVVPLHLVSSICMWCLILSTELGLGKVQDKLSPEALWWFNDFSLLGWDVEGELL